MKNLIIGIIFGAASGSGITYLIMKKREKKIVEQLRSDVRKEYKEYYERQQIEENDAIATHVKSVPDKPIPDDIDAYKLIAKHYNSNSNVDRADSEFPSEEDLIEQSEAIDNMHEILSESHEKPKLITVEQFGEINSFDTESLTYYVYDHTLVHEDEMVVDDEDYILGDALDRYGWRDDDEDESPLYVRNYKLQKDYEIIKIMDEYPDKS